MITPQQRNAWRGAYLRQLRKVADSTPNPWMDEIEWEDLLEDRLTQFIYRDYLTFLKTVVFVFQNHPLVLAGIDSAFINDTDACSVSQLFLFLRTLTPYDRYGVVSSIDCPKDVQQRIMSSLDKDDEGLFIRTTKDYDLGKLCCSIGYVYKIIFGLHCQIQMMEHQELTENEENRVEELWEDLGERSSKPDSKTIHDNADEQLSLAKQNSTLVFDDLPSELEYLQDEYYGIVLQWVPFSIVVDAFFLPKELSIVESVLHKWVFVDINKDLLHLCSFVNKDYHYQRIALPL